MFTISFRKKDPFREHQKNLIFFLNSEPNKKKKNTKKKK